MRLSVISLVLALAACTSNTNSPPVSASASPGPGLLAARDAGALFADLCLVREASVNDTKQKLAALPFTQSASTGTYFHDRASFSVNINAERCSVVYGTNKPTDQVVAELAKGTAAVISGPLPIGIDVTSRAAADGLRYFNLRVPRPLSFP